MSWGKGKDELDAFYRLPALERIAIMALGMGFATIGATAMKWWWLQEGNSLAGACLILGAIYVALKIGVGKTCTAVCEAMATRTEGMPGEKRTTWRDHTIVAIVVTPGCLGWGLLLQWLVAQTESGTVKLAIALGCGAWLSVAGAAVLWWRSAEPQGGEQWTSRSGSKRS